MSASSTSVEVERRRAAAPRACRLVRAVMRPFFDGRAPVGAAGARSPIERGLVALVDGDRDAGVRETHRDAAAHRAEAEHCRLADRSRCRVLGQVGNLGRSAFGEERMPQRARLGRLDQLNEDLRARTPCLRRTASCTAASTASTHLSRAQAGRATALATAWRARRRTRRRSTPAGNGDLLVAQLRMAAALPRPRARKRQHAVEDRAFDDTFDQPVVQSALRRRSDCRW